MSLDPNCWCCKIEVADEGWLREVHRLLTNARAPASFKLQRTSNGVRILALQEHVQYPMEERIRHSVAHQAGNGIK